MHLTCNWQYFFLLQIFYKLTINLTKLSILALYLRIFTENYWFRKSCWCLIFVVVGASISFTVATTLQCTPISHAWDRWSGSESCINIGALWYSNAIYNITTDFIIVLMVPPVIFKLKLPVRQKLALTCVFGLGIIVCAASVFRLTTLYSSAYGEDVTAGSLIATVWTTVEAGLGVICTNLPMVRTPLQHFFPKLFPSRTGTNRISSRSRSRSSRRSNSEELASPARLIVLSNMRNDLDLPAPVPAMVLPPAFPAQARQKLRQVKMEVHGTGDLIGERSSTKGRGLQVPFPERSSSYGRNLDCYGQQEGAW